jgi:hypothetical protein
MWLPKTSPLTCRYPKAVSNCFYFLVLFDNYLCVPLPIMYFTLILLSDMTADVTDCKKQFLCGVCAVCVFVVLCVQMCKLNYSG